MPEMAPSRVLRIAGLLLAPFPDRAAVIELFALADKDYRRLEFPNLSLEDSVNQAIGEAARDGWLPELVRKAAASRPTDIGLAGLAAEFFAGPPIGGADHFDRCRLSGGYYLINRAPLRASLRELHRPDGQRILVVTGETQTGKSYTKYLIWHLRDMLESFATVDIDLERRSRLLGPDRVFTPEDIARLLISELDYNDFVVPPAPQDQQWARWTLEFCDAFSSRARTDLVRRWVVIDAFNKVVLTTPVLDLVKELALRVSEQLSRFRLILMGFAEPLPLDVGPTVRPDRPDPITEIQLSEFLVGYLREVGATLDDTARTERAAKFVTEVLEGIAAPPGYLLELNQRITVKLPKLGRLSPMTNVDPPSATNTLVQDILAHVARLREAKSVASVAVPMPEYVPAPDPTYDGLHEAAAVLGWFHPDRLQPTRPVREGARSLLIAGAIAVTDDAGQRSLSLPADTRVAVLRQLREQDGLAAALASNPGEPGDTLGRLLREHLIGQPGRVDSLNLTDLNSTAMVLAWLSAAGFPVTAQDAVARRTAWLTLLEPFTLLAGEHFRGRTDELAALRRFAGIVAPGATGAAEIARSPEGLVPMVIYGPGGVGKSTLVARFILEHAQALERDRFPFAYLDFDRPDVDAAEPLTLLIEAIRQLAIEYPELGDRGTPIREGWLRLLAEPDLPVRARTAAAADFGRLLHSIGAGGRPILLVLDTFEEVQWRSVEYATQIMTMLAELNRYVPRLRVVIAGRAQILELATEELPADRPGLGFGAGLLGRSRHHRLGGRRPDRGEGRRGSAEPQTGRPGLPCLTAGRPGLA